MGTSKAPALGSSLNKNKINGKIHKNYGKLKTTDVANSRTQ